MTKAKQATQNREISSYYERGYGRVTFGMHVDRRNGDTAFRNYKCKLLFNFTVY